MAHITPEQVDYNLYTSKKQYPFGYSGWINAVWQECKKRGIVSKDTTPINKGLDYDAWLDYFMAGYSPIKAIEQDIKEQD